MTTSTTGVLRWFFLCDLCSGSRSTNNDVKRMSDGPGDRWRLVCWTFLSTCVWYKLAPTLLNFLYLHLCIASLLCLVQLITSNLVTQSLCLNLKSGFLALLILGLLNTATLVTSHSRHYLSYEYLAKKIVLHEYQLFRVWCPNTYLILVSITGLALFVRRFPSRLYKTLGCHLDT